MRNSPQWSKPAIDTRFTLIAPSKQSTQTYEPARAVHCRARVYGCCVTGQDTNSANSSWRGSLGQHTSVDRYPLFSQSTHTYNQHLHSLTHSLTHTHTLSIYIQLCGLLLQCKNNQHRSKQDNGDQMKQTRTETDSS